MGERAQRVKASEVVADTGTQAISNAASVDDVVRAAAGRAESGAETQKRSQARTQTVDVSERTSSGTLASEGGRERTNALEPAVGDDIDPQREITGVLVHRSGGGRE